MDQLSDYGLRDRKIAQTKKAIIDCMVRSVESKPLAEISVKEICDEVQISSASFFNYFPKKQDLIIYYIRLFTLEVAGFLNTSKLDAGIPAIEGIFRFTETKMQAHPRMMLEIITYLAQADQPPSREPIAKIDRLMQFPDQPHILQLQAIDLGELFQFHLKAAVSDGKLPPTTNIDAALTLVGTVFYGSPLVHRIKHPHSWEGVYQANLAAVWKALAEE